MDEMNVFHEALQTQNRVELCKAGLLNALEKLYGNDEQKWLQALAKARPKMKGHYLIALDQLVKALEKRVGMEPLAVKLRRSRRLESERRGDVLKNV